MGILRIQYEKKMNRTVYIFFFTAFGVWCVLSLFGWFGKRGGAGKFVKMVMLAMMMICLLTQLGQIFVWCLIYSHSQFVFWLLLSTIYNLWRTSTWLCFVSGSNGSLLSFSFGAFCPSRNPFKGWPRRPKTCPPGCEGEFLSYGNIVICPFSMCTLLSSIKNQRNHEWAKQTSDFC